MEIPPSEPAAAVASPELDEFSALQQVISALRPMSEEARRRLLEAAATFLKIPVAAPHHTLSRSATGGVSATPPTAAFSEDTSISAKDFILEKQPRTDVERIACLAYFLTHYRSTAHFKTLEISKLNTEAAQPKFANAATSANNAVKMGYLVPSTKGQRQLSAVGERFVRALPDRDAAKAALETLRRRPKIRRSKAVTPPEPA